MKSLPVYFYVQSGRFDTTKTPILFEVESLNIGGALNLTSGKFTAPRDGIYSFSFSGFAYLPASSSRAYLDLDIFLNGIQIGNGLADEATSTDVQNEAYSFQSTLKLQKGDQIWLEIHSISTGAYLVGSRLTHFSGYLLEEKMSQSLIVM